MGLIGLHRLPLLRPEVSDYVIMPTLKLPYLNPTGTCDPLESKKIFLLAPSMGPYLLERALKGPILGDYRIYCGFKGALISFEGKFQGSKSYFKETRSRSETNDRTWMTGRLSQSA